MLMLPAQKVFAQTLAQPIYPDFESVELMYFDAKDGSRRMNSKANLQKTTEKRKEIFRYANNGVGEWNGHVDADFKQFAKLEPFEGGVRVIESESKVLDENGRDLEKFVKEYDYEDNEVVYIHKTRRGATRKFERFKIEGPICDDVTLVYFLKSYNIKDFIDEPYHMFYLLTNEPKMYKVRMTFLENDILTINGVRRKAVKYQLKADMGVLTDIAAKIAPPTYVWYDRDYPYEWLQYQGMETGFRSPYIRVTVQERSYEAPK